MRSSEMHPAPSMTLVKDWFVQCLSGLSYMHEQRILHQDIKPDNILLSRTKQIKIADLGLACVAQRMMSNHSKVGASTYQRYEKRMVVVMMVKMMCGDWVVYLRSC